MVATDGVGTDIHKYYPWILGQEIHWDIIFCFESPVSVTQIVFLELEGPPVKSFPIIIFVPTPILVKLRY